MAVQSDQSRVSYTGSGTTGPFAIPPEMWFLSDEDITVLKVLISDGTETTLALTTDYTLSGAGEEAGGSLTLVATLSSSYRLVIIRDPDDTQATRYPANDAFPSASHEEALDRRTMVSQRTRSLVARSLRQPDGDSAEIDKLAGKGHEGGQNTSPSNANENPVATTGNEPCGPDFPFQGNGG